MPSLLAIACYFHTRRCYNIASAFVNMNGHFHAYHDPNGFLEQRFHLSLSHSLLFSPPRKSRSVALSTTLLHPSNLSPPIHSSRLHQTGNSVNVQLLAGISILNSDLNYCSFPPFLLLCRPSQCCENFLPVSHSIKMSTPKDANYFMSRKVARIKIKPRKPERMTEDDLKHQGAEKCAANLGFRTVAGFFNWLDSPQFKPFFLKYSDWKKTHDLSQQTVKPYLRALDEIAGESPE